MEKQIRTRDIKLVPIGNSKGVRTQALLQKYGLNDSLLLEETDKGLLIRKKEDNNKLSWEDTYKAMANAKEDWGDFDTMLLDGLENEDFEH